MPYKYNVSPDKPTFIYCLKDPRDGSVKYVGKTDNPEQRLAAHCAVTKRSLGKKRIQWLLELRRAGLKPELEILEETTFGQHKNRESYWMHHFSRMGENLTNGYAHIRAKPAGVGIRKDQSKKIKKMAKEMRLNYTTLVRVLLDYALENPPVDLHAFAMRLLEEQAKD